jgi:hypothetical protein
MVWLGQRRADAVRLYSPHAVLKDVGMVLP